MKKDQYRSLISKWISWPELAGRWGLKDIDVFDYVANGLQPYSINGVPLYCPVSHHRYTQLSMRRTHLVEYFRSNDALSTHKIKEKNDVLPGVETEKPASKKQQSIMKELKNDNKRYEAELEEINTEMQTICNDDTALSSWKYFVMPEMHSEAEELMEEMRKALFKYGDISEFEDRFKIKVKDVVQARPKVRFHKSNLKKYLIRRKAEEIWNYHPEITIADMIKRPDIQALARGEDEKAPLSKTIRNWIKDLCKYRDPGRRPGSTSKK